MKRIKALISFVRPYYNSPDPAHDWAHIERVASTASRLAEETGANEELVLAAVYCHDLVNLPKDHPERKEASFQSAQEAKSLLENCGFGREEIAIIQKAIVEHSFSSGLQPSSLEASIVQDADRLDALGAIGILRCAAVNAQMKSQFYDPNDPLAETRNLDDKKWMVDHYFVKLFRLPELMNTEAGRKLADKRVAFMKSFLLELKSEIS